MFVPDVRPILQAHKQAQQLCKPGVLKTVAHKCINQEIPPSAAAEWCRSLLTAMYVVCIFEATHLILVGTIWLCHIHHSGARLRKTQGFDNVRAEDADDQEREEYHLPVNVQARNRDRRTEALVQRQAVRRRWIGRKEESWLSDASSST